MPPDKETRQAVAYLRVSAVMGRGDELISPELQRFEIDTFAARNGFTVVHEIQDIDKSGRSFTKRRVGEVIEGINQGKWRYVLLWKWSRWGRNLQQSLLYLAMIEQAGGIVRAATEDFDPTTTMGKFTRDQMLLIAELQSNQISDSWRETHAKRRRDGLPHSGQKRFGYDYTRATGYIPNPDQARALADAYERYVYGTPMRSLALEWNARGILTVRGATWSPQAFGRMLDTGFAAGLIREQSEQPNDGSKNASRGNIAAYDVWREGKHEAIISFQLWEAYKAKRLASALTAPRHRTAVHALSELLRCGECKYVMVTSYSSAAKGGVHYWTCYQARDNKRHPSNRITNARAVADVLAWVERMAIGGENVTEDAAKAEAGRAATSDVLRYAAEEASLIRQRKRLVDAYTEPDSVMDADDYRTRGAELKAKLLAVQAGLAAAKERENAAGMDVVRTFGTIRDEWPKWSEHAKREALATVIRRIDILMGPYGPGKLVPVPAWEE